MKNFYNISKSVFLLLLLWVFNPEGVFAQALSGNYTIGSGGQYASFTAAVTDLNTKGVSYPVVFDVISATYSEQIILGPVNGASNTNTITFQSQTGNSQDIILSHAAVGVNDNYVIFLENASHYLLKNLTVQAAGSMYARTIRGQVELHNIVFEGNVIISASTSSDIRFLSNSIIGGSYWIFHQGTNINNKINN